MPKPKKRPILVPVDFSPHSEAALLKACEFAECPKLPIVVLHVVHDPGDMPSYYSKITKKKQLVRVEDVAAEIFADFMKSVRKKHPDNRLLKKASTMLVRGIPVTRILQVAEKIDASMVVMGSLGRTRLSHVLLGSKAEQVVRQCPVPVTIVKSDPPATG
jgi:nucleotide-binding universal stress UspA family protein